MDERCILKNNGLKRTNLRKKRVLKKRIYFLKVDTNELVVFDLDENVVSTPFEDVSMLPTPVKTLLKEQLLGKRAHLIGDGIVRAFMRATCAMLGQWRTGLKVRHTVRASKRESDLNFCIVRRALLCAQCAFLMFYK